MGMGKGRGEQGPVGGRGNREGEIEMSLVRLSLFVKGVSGECTLGEDKEGEGRGDTVNEVGEVEKCEEKFKKPLKPLEAVLMGGRGAKPAKVL